MNRLPIVAIRPQPGNRSTLAAAQELGLVVCGHPMFSVEPLPWTCPDPARFDGLALGSANAIRHGGDQLRHLRALPVHAVGEATAQAARSAGFTVAGVGTGDLAALLAGMTGPLRLLRLAGEEHVAAVPPPGIVVETCTVYTVRALPCPEPLSMLLHEGCVVLLHSAAAARHFARECERIAVRRERVALACLAPRVVAAAGRGWRAVASANSPTDAALLALAGQMCQTDAIGVTDNRTGNER